MSASAQTSEQPLSGEVTAAQPRVSFPLQLTAGQPVTLTTAPTANFDTVLTLNGPDGRAVAENDDRGDGDLSSRIVFVPPTTGRYTAVVTGFGGATGAFQLNVTGLDFGLSSSARTLREERVSLTARRREVRLPVQLAEGDIFVGSTFALAATTDSPLG